MPTECDNVDLFADGALDDVRAEAFRRHLPGCAECQAALDEHLQFRLLATEYGKSLPPLRPEQALSPRTSGLRRWLFPWSLVAVGALAVALAVFVNSGRGHAPPAQVAAALDLQQPRRRIEARPSHPALQPYRPLAERSAMMGGSSPAETLPLQDLGPLARHRDHEALLAAFLVRGDAKNARDQLEILEKKGSSPVLKNDGAVIYLLERKPREALTLLDEALRQNPGYLPAMWNRALALEAMGEREAAARAFQEVADRGEAGWSQEAGEKAKALLKAF